MSHVAKTEDGTFLVELSEPEAEILMSLCGAIGGDHKQSGRTLTDKLWEQFGHLDVDFLGGMFRPTLVDWTEHIPTKAERCGEIIGLTMWKCVLPPGHSGTHTNRLSELKNHAYKLCGMHVYQDQRETCVLPEGHQGFCTEVLQGL